MLKLTDPGDGQAGSAFWIYNDGAQGLSGTVLPMAEGAVVAIPPVTPLGKAPGGAGQSTPWTESRRAKFGMDGLGRQSQMGSGTPHTAGELLSAPWQKEPVHCGMECGCTTANTRWFKWDHENDNPIGFLCWPCGRNNYNLFGRTPLKSIKEEEVAMKVRTWISELLSRSLLLGNAAGIHLHGAGISAASFGLF